MAVSTMTIQDIEKEYGPVQVVNSIEQALKDESLTKRDFTNKQPLATEADALAILAGFGISMSEIERLREQVKIIPQAKL
jgi:hypothetical protein